jgi:hypothetical protein
VVEAGKTHGKYADVFGEHGKIEDLALTLSSKERGVNDNIQQEQKNARLKKLLKPQKSS